MENTRRVFYNKLNAEHDIRLLFAGSMSGGSSEGSRPYHLLHYVTRGEGTVSTEHSCQDLSAGDLFLHYPNKATSYKPADDNPWTYCWMAFDGPLANAWVSSLRADHSRPFCRGEYDPQISVLFDQLLDAMARTSITAMLQSEATMRLILGKLLLQFGTDRNLRKTTTPVMAVRHAQDFMLMHYAEMIGVNEVCRAIGYERTYFSNLFRHQTGQTMQEYLAAVRITHACSLLTSTELSVNAIAQRVGYAEYRSFSRCFKKIKQVSPQQYRSL